MEIRVVYEIKARSCKWWDKDYTDFFIFSRKGWVNSIKERLKDDVGLQILLNFLYSMK